MPSPPQRKLLFVASSLTPWGGECGSSSSFLIVWIKLWGITFSLRCCSSKMHPEASSMLQAASAKAHLIYRMNLPNLSPAKCGRFSVTLLHLLPVPRLPSRQHGMSLSFFFPHRCFFLGLFSTCLLILGLGADG